MSGHISEVDIEALKRLADSMGFGRTHDMLRRVIAVANSHAELVKALERCERLIKEALPKFNWGASALDANAIALLNEVPGEVRKALAKVRT